MNSEGDARGRDGWPRSHAKRIESVKRMTSTGRIVSPCDQQLCRHTISKKLSSGRNAWLTIDDITLMDLASVVYPTEASHAEM